MWTVVLLASVSVSFVMSLALCLCWRKKVPKNDLLGLDGMVTPKNPDENVNHLPSAAPPCENDSADKRNTIATNTRRSLPDIPSEQGAAANWEQTDNTSDYYATVGQYQNGKRHLPTGIEPQQSLSQHSSISQADDAFSPYEKVKYDKIKSREHPYAQLQPTTSRQAILENVEERTSLLRPGGSSTSSEPSAPPRSRRSSAHSSLGIEIPAASAVAGGIAASPELPYMTPPVTQGHFSGDSQDSSKGYTRITVREPLPILLPQRAEIAKDQVYSTVSDDSDDVYTTIPDPNTSESETYARIPPHPITVEAEVNPTPPRMVESSPVPHSSHSRQASSSSSIANVGSPKPEKRQANSPLPPPPSTSTEVVGRNLDDLYAKVHKTKKKDEEEDESKETVCAGSSREHNYETLKKLDKHLDEPGYASIHGPESLASSDPGYEVLKQRPDPNYEELRNSSGGYSRINYAGKQSDDKSSSVGSNSLEEPNYESMPSESFSSDPNYAAIGSESDPNYESVKDLEEPPYERLNDSKDSSKGYEDVDTSDGDAKSECYERLNNDDSEVPGYDKVGGREEPRVNGLLHADDSVVQV